MKVKIFSAFSVVFMLMAVIGGSAVEASAYTANFVTSITYQNVGSAPATVTIQFFAENNGTPITISRPELAPMAGTSVYVGSLSELSAGFRGSAMISSDQPLVATLVQVPDAGSGVKVRPLSNGFTNGSSYVLIPTALRDTFGYNSIISVQNVDSVAADLDLVFVPISGSPINVSVTELPAHSTKYFDLAQMPDFTGPFNGSVQIYAFKAGTTDPGAVVASALELSILSTGAYAFEGTEDFANTVYMPSSLCSFNGVYTSAYAVQNTTASDVDVTVTYSGGAVDGPHTLSAGAKRSFNACDVNSAGHIGSAQISATGEIVAMGKIFGGGLSTAFVGFTSGGEKVALPYIRWTTSHWFDGTRQRAYIAIQNVGAALAAGDVTVKYYDKDGVLVGTDTLDAIDAGAKANSNAGNIGVAGEEFGYYTDGSFGGSAVVEGPTGSQLAVVVRIQSMSGSLSVGEDYSGIKIQ